MQEKLYKKIASLLNAIENCKKSNNTKWFEKHSEKIELLVKNCMPSGSGFDCGTTLALERSTPEKLVFITSYHHMNTDGYYDGWTDHTVTVQPSLQFDFTLTVLGENRNDIKDYMHDVFSEALNTLVE